MKADDVREGAELLRLRSPLTKAREAIRDNVAESGKVQIDIGQVQIDEYDCAGRVSPATGRWLINAMLGGVTARLNTLGIEG